MGAWQNNSVQYPRLIAEAHAAGAFTLQVTPGVDVITEMAASMDLERSDVEALIDRACDDWDAIKAELETKFESGSGAFTVYFSTSHEGKTTHHHIKRPTLKAAKIEALEQARIRDIPFVSVMKGGLEVWCTKP